MSPTHLHLTRCHAHLSYPVGIHWPAPAALLNHTRLPTRLYPTRFHLSLFLLAPLGRGRQTIGSLELLLDETADPAWLARARKEAAAAPAAPPPAPPILPSAQRALLQAGVRPQLVEPTKKVVLRG